MSKERLISSHIYSNLVDVYRSLKSYFEINYQRVIIRLDLYTMNIFEEQDEYKWVTRTLKFVNGQNCWRKPEALHH